MSDAINITDWGAGQILFLVWLGLSLAWNFLRAGKPKTKTVRATDGVEVNTGPMDAAFGATILLMLLVMGGFFA
ncbi:MAG TPA: hypothetical protein DHW63_01050 [Hyphomonadaceae bacterium]|nr:hypothetical protein [Hyphomonadaceae bacterium]